MRSVEQASTSLIRCHMHSGLQESMTKLNLHMKRVASQEESGQCLALATQTLTHCCR